jgi:hypothetical protein
MEKKSPGFGSTIPLRWQAAAGNSNAAGKILLVLVILAAILVVVSNFGLTLITLALAGAFVFSLRGAFIPATYTITPLGLRRRRLLGSGFFPWSRVRRLEELPRGIFLSPHRRPSRLDGFHGWFVPLPPHLHRDIVERIRELTDAGREEASHGSE